MSVYRQKSHQIRDLNIKDSTVYNLCYSSFQTPLVGLRVAGCQTTHRDFAHPNELRKDKP